MVSSWAVGAGQRKLERPTGTIVEPGPFRTVFLSRWVRFARKASAGYGNRRNEVPAAIEQRNGTEPGDPAKFPQVIVRLSRVAGPPPRLLAASFAVDTAKENLTDICRELDLGREAGLFCPICRRGSQH